MKAFIVNLKDHVERRNYIISLLSSFQQIKPCFIEAVDGRAMAEDKKNKAFASEMFLKEYNRPVLQGELGCTLSHQKIYHKIVSEHIKTAIVFEDDIIIRENIDDHIPKIETLLDTNKPTIILLSGWFWFTNTNRFDKNHRIAKVIDGYLTHAYAINFAAAQLMLSERPYLLADAWEKYAKFGINIYGITPHLIDQDWTNFESSITSIKTRGYKIRTFSQWCKIKRRTSIQHILKTLGKFEPK